MNNKEIQNYLFEYARILREETPNREQARTIAAYKTKIEEENSNHVLVYVGTYKVDKYIEKAIETITFEEDPKAKYKRYIDIETGQLYNVNMNEVEGFEEENKVIYRPVLMNNYMLYYQQYQKVRDEFFEGILREPQEKVVLKLTNKD